MLQRIFLSEFPAELNRDGRWFAQWIAPRVSMSSSERSTWFRLQTSLASAQRIRLFVAADADYRLFIDGERVAEGPEQGDRAHTYVDVFDWEAAPGPHRLEVLVTSFGEKGPWSRMEFQHGLLLAVSGDDAERWNTGSGAWECADSALFSWKAPFGWVTPVGEEQIFHASATIDADSSLCWEKAVSYFPGVSAEAGQAENALPLLYPARLPDRRLDSLMKFDVRFVGNPQVEHFFREEENKSAEVVRWQKGLTEGDFRIPSHCSCNVLLELENYACAVPELTVSQGRGASLALGWAEALFLDSKEVGIKHHRADWANRYFIGFYDYFEPDGRERIPMFTLRYRAGRFLLLKVKTDDEPLVLHRLQLRENRYPLTIESGLYGVNHTLTTLSEMCQRTLMMCMHDTYMDCPYYEQLMYVGDTRLQMLLTLVLSRDSRLPERALTLLAASQTEAGFVHSRYPSRFPQLIPTFTPAYIGMIADYARWRGGALPHRLFASAMRGVEAFEPFLNRDGLVALEEAGWNFVDWSGWTLGVPPMDSTGVSGVVNALYLYALAEAIGLCVLLGEKDKEKSLRQKITAFAVRFCTAFWDDEKGLFCNIRTETEHCEHLQALALLSGVLPEPVAARCLDSLAGRDFEVKASCYFSYYLFEAFTRMGRSDLIESRLGEFYDMVRCGLKTVREQPEPTRSDCHAWSSHILFHLYASWLGVRPAGEGFAEVLIRPARNLPPGVTGRIVHPRGGCIVVRHGDGDSFEVELPEFLNGRFWRDNGEPLLLHPGLNRIGGSEKTF